MAKQKTFRLKRTAKKYQSSHGGRIVGTTGAYKVVKNSGKRRRPSKLKGWAHVQRNVAAGFYDEDGYFHPIRASYDYSSKRAGESRKKAPAKKGRKKANATLSLDSLGGWIRAKAVKIEKVGGKKILRIKR